MDLIHVHVMFCSVWTFDRGPGSVCFFVCWFVVAPFCLLDIVTNFRSCHTLSNLKKFLLGDRLQSHQPGHANTSRSSTQKKRFAGAARVPPGPGTKSRPQTTNAANKPKKGIKIMGFLTRYPPTRNPLEPTTPPGPGPKTATNASLPP